MEYNKEKERLDFKLPQIYRKKIDFICEETYKTKTSFLKDMIDREFRNIVQLKSISV